MNRLLLSFLLYIITLSTHASSLSLNVIYQDPKGLEIVRSTPSGQGKLTIENENNEVYVVDPWFTNPLLINGYLRTHHKEILTYNNIKELCLRYCGHAFLYKLGSSFGGVKKMVLSPDRSTQFIIGTENSRLVDMRKITLGWLSYNTSIKAAVFSPNSHWLSILVRSENSLTIDIWDAKKVALEEDKKVGNIKASNCNVIAWFGDKVLAVGDGKEIKLYKKPFKKPFKKLSDHQAAVRMLVGDSDRLVSVDENDELIIWGDDHKRSYTKAFDEIENVSLCPKGVLITTLEECFLWNKGLAKAELLRIDEDMVLYPYLKNNILYYLTSSEELVKYNLNAKKLTDNEVIERKDIKPAKIGLEIDYEYNRLVYATESKVYSVNCQ